MAQNIVSYDVNDYLEGIKQSEVSPIDTTQDSAAIDTTQATSNNIVSYDVEDIAPPLPVDPRMRDNVATRLGEKFTKRGESFAQDIESLKSGDKNVVEFAASSIGNTVYGTINDIAGEAVATVFSTLLPDEAEDYLKELISSKSEELMSSDTAKQLLSLYQDLEPDERDLLTSAGNVLMGQLTMTPLIKMPGGKFLKESAAKSKYKKQQKVFNESILDNREKVRQVRDQGLSAAQKKTDKDLLNTFISVKGVSTIKPMSWNKKAVKKEIDKLQNQLLKEAANPKYKNVIFTKKSITDKVKRDVTELKNPSSPKYSAAYKSPKYEPIFDQMDNLLEDVLIRYAGIKSKDILKIRRELDEAVELIAGTDEVFKKTNAGGDILREYRNSLNSILDDVTEGATKSTRERLHKLYVINANLARNAEGKGIIGKTVQYAKSHPFLAGSVASGTGLLSDPNMQTLLGLGATGYLGTRGLVNPAFRTGLGNVVERSPYLTASGMLSRDLEALKEEEQ